MRSIRKRAEKRLQEPVSCLAEAEPKPQFPEAVTLNWGMLAIQANST